MEKTKFIFRIETEFHVAMVTRICAAFSRSRIPIEELQVNMIAEQQRFAITFFDTRDNAHKLSRKLDGQVDVISVTIFEETTT